MLGADLSVFWQELIDAYRDIMVVKNTSDARNYLDLTDAEYEKLVALAASFNTQKLLYHSSVLEEALADLIRARESKRSVAEIALTRMCDARLASTPEALLQRIEDLEAAVSRLKFGAVSAPAERPAEKLSEQKPVKEPLLPKSVSQPPAAAESASRPYSKWGRVVSGVETAKASIYSPLSKAVALQNSDGSFLIKIDAFFVKIIGENRENTAILKGLIAECEGVNPDEVKISIVPKTVGEVATLADEVENALKN